MGIKYGTAFNALIFRQVISKENSPAGIDVTKFSSFGFYTLGYFLMFA